MVSKKYEVEFGGAYDGSEFFSEEEYFAESALDVAKKIKAECLAGLWVHHSKKDFEAGKAWFVVSDESGYDSVKVESLKDLEGISVPPVERASAWNKANTKAIIIRFNKESDKAVLEKLSGVPNKTAYIRDLILKDIGFGLK